MNNSFKKKSEINVICRYWKLISGLDFSFRIYVPVVIFFNLFLLEYNCFTMLCFCCTLKWSSYKYTKSFPSWACLQPSGHYRAPSWVPCAARQVPTSRVMCGSVYMSILTSQFVPPSPSPLWCPYVHSLPPSLYKNRVICTIFLDSTWPVVIDYSIINEPTKCLKFLLPLDTSLVSQVETESIVKLSPKAFYPQIFEIKSFWGHPILFLLMEGI